MSDILLTAVCICDFYHRYSTSAEIFSCRTRCFIARHLLSYATISSRDITRHIGFPCTNDRPVKEGRSLLHTVGFFEIRKLFYQKYIFARCFVKCNVFHPKYFHEKVGVNYTCMFTRLSVKQFFIESLA